ncbi:hypothetical protein [Gluconacetobacter liquefaciens]|uniref:Uncharacterized protein n=1 Tax=Gluconacetobacter liquefaciens TaxID=89584 RepID=A0A370FVS6_GLULI|nr:hypothetical protein [Gluconacetobacter liquefaciens]MBB2187356.1 hypothetical protein [Gluconacetobacter liquefaciens]RDI35488.1 hypothetical protein C7453_11423 [Gluconacetobacter liquefaciens]
MMKAIVTVLLVFLAALPAQGREVAGFSGTWCLDEGESDYRDLQQPEARRDAIVDHGDRITDEIVATARGRAQHVTLDLPTDGSVVRFPERTVLGTSTLRTAAARREGGTLVVTQEVRTGDTLRVAVMRWALSADRARLVMTVAAEDGRHVVGTLVFRRGVPSR